MVDNYTAFNVAKLRGLIAEKDITQEVLAEAIGMTLSALNSKLKGRSEFKLNEISRIARYFDVDVVTFFKR